MFIKKNTSNLNRIYEIYNSTINQVVNKYEINPYFIDIKERCDSYLKNKIKYTDCLDMETCFVEYNFYDYKWNRTPNQDLEWTYMLNRHGFIYDLALAYKVTNQKKYLEKFKEYLYDFIECNKDYKMNPEAWRPLDVGIRLLNWAKAFRYVSFFDDINDKERDILIESIKYQINYIKNNYIRKYDLSNWGVLSLTGVAAWLVLHPDLTSDDNFKEYVFNKLKIQLDIQFYNDNIHWEQSPLYHHEVTMSFLYLYNLERLLDIQLIDYLKEKLKNIIGVTYYYINNSEVLLSLNDSDNVKLSFVYDCYRSLKMLNDKKSNYDMSIFIGKQNDIDIDNKNIKYKETFFGKQSGLFIQKNDTIYFSAFNGSHGSSHGHASNGSITLDIDGINFIVDPGRYSYDEKKERIFLKSEKAHNSIYVENFDAMEIRESWGYNSVIEPLLNNFSYFKYGWILEMNWYSKNNILYRRNIIYLSEIESYIIYDRVNGISKNDVMKKYLQINPKINIISSINHINLKHNEKILNLWFFDDEITIEDSVYSRRYNLIENNKKIVFKPKYVDEVRDSLTILSKNNLTVTKLEVNQNKRKSAMNLVKGIEIQNKDKNYQIIFARKPVTSGDKLFVTRDKVSIYGQINLIKDRNFVFRLK
ncbi:heparinase II/III family protein [Helcococcus kunzii]|uniref:Uncharacterized protein n=1 Tax=Helcococcus kunzii ATCC 51366 TaxID=883114 RepID=H3NQL5_9FIRM|nr:heparinase II/III family protein [Helcococcus kunzii]EHR32345.1 hypothetical protein HMPREF9709_01626 [Helcococcus kunzii ATCC 51366]MCT1796508.1 heparinase II/III family protein [Helcococcus kunzii]MCT1988320.1 heparinase II/III family protein [Helcococcus kunzii]